MLYPALSALFLPSFLTAGGLGLPAVLAGLLAIPWFIRLPKLALAFLFLSLVAGQTIRLPLPGQAGGLLLSDIAVVLVLLSAAFRFIWKIPCPPKPRAKAGVIGHLFLPFIIWSLFTLAIKAPTLGPPNTGLALAYWIRLSSHLLLLPALLLLFRNTGLAAFARRGLIIATALLVLLGFLQLWLIPNLDNLVGWDPHQGRLVSTWLDPNFFGAFLTLMLPFIIARSLRTSNFPGGGRRLLPRWLWVSSALIIFIALILTQSRSTLVALALSLLILSPLLVSRLLRRPTASRVMSTLSTIALLILFAGLGALLLKDRIVGLASFDATVTLRFTALQQVWQLAQDNSLLGVGYNAYQFAAKPAGLIGDFSIHSRAGADNSFLTLWVTTGIGGLILFLLPWAVIAHTLIRRYLAHFTPSTLAALAGLTTLTIHSQFVNSLLYTHLLITLITLTALALKPPVSD